MFVSHLRLCALPPGLSPAALELMKRLQAQSAKAAKKKDPAKAVKLIDRLKDLQLQGLWARAMSLFDNHPAESREWRWQSFHYRIVLQMLVNANQPQHGIRLWQAMKARPDVSLDEQTANDAMVVLCHAGKEGTAPLDELTSLMEQRQYRVLGRAMKALERRRTDSWESALAYIANIAAVSQDDTRVADELTRLLMKHAMNPDAVQVIRSVMRAHNIRESGEEYAAMIRASSTWEEAMLLLNECTQRSTPTTRTYNELLQRLHAAHQAALMEHVIDDMNIRQVQHSKHTVELVMRFYETTSRWQQATEYFSAMKSAGVPPTNRGYASLIKCYNRSRRSDRVMPVFDAMRRDGFQGDARDTVSLINAWSTNRMTRMSRER